MDNKHVAYNPAAVNTSLVTLYRRSFGVLLVGGLLMMVLYLTFHTGTSYRSLSANLQVSIVSGPAEDKSEAFLTPYDVEEKKDFNASPSTQYQQSVTMSPKSAWGLGYDEYYMKSSLESRSELKTVRFLRGWTNNPGVTKSDTATNFPSLSMDLCGYRCKIERGDTNPSGADLAVFLSVGLGKSSNVPKKKPSDLWVFHSGESQYRSPQNTRWDGYFNYSTSFVPEPNNHNSMWALPIVKKAQPGYRNFAEERRISLRRDAKVEALWFVSHCLGGYAPKSARAQYALELSKYINISAYSFKTECRKMLTSIIKTESKDRQPRINDFLFYLSFESQVCKDYISEKLWKVLTMDTFTIPVVLGGQSIEDYTRVAPPNSFIHVRNFTSPRHLAEHLEYVASNDDAYNYYHQWRNDYELVVKTKTNRMLCHYCMLAHERPPDIWQTFSTDFSPNDCTDLSKPEHYCPYYNMSCTNTT